MVVTQRRSVSVLCDGYNGIPSTVAWTVAANWQDKSPANYAFFSASKVNNMNGDGTMDENGIAPSIVIDEVLTTLLGADCRNWQSKRYRRTWLPRAELNWSICITERRRFFR